MKFATKPHDDDMYLRHVARLRFDKVKESLKVGTFSGHSVAYFSNANSPTASLLFSVLDLTYDIN